MKASEIRCHDDPAAAIMVDELNVAQSITVSVKTVVKKSLRVRFGVFIIRIGCLISGIGFKE